MTARGQQGQVLLHQLRAEGVGVGIDALFSRRPAHGKAVIETLAPARHGGFEKTRIALAQRDKGLGRRGVEHGHALRTGQQRAQPQTPGGIAVQSQTSKRVRVAGSQQGVGLGLIQHQPRLLTDQTRSTYSAIVRSDENDPMAATFKHAFRAQAAGSLYSTSTRVWVAQ